MFRTVAAVGFVTCLAFVGCAGLTAAPPSVTPTPQGLDLGSALTPESSLLGAVDAAAARADWPQSIRLLEQLLNRDPTSVVYVGRLYDAHLALGHEEISHGDVAAAQRDFSIAKAIDPSRDEAATAIAATTVFSTPTADSATPEIPTIVPTVAASAVPTRQAAASAATPHPAPVARKPSPTPAPPRPGLVSAGVFTMLPSHATRQQVLEIMGKPDHVTTMQFGSTEYWCYIDKVYFPQTGNIVHLSEVLFTKWSGPTVSSAYTGCHLR